MLSSGRSGAQPAGEIASVRITSGMSSRIYHRRTAAPSRRPHFGHDAIDKARETSRRAFSSARRSAVPPSFRTVSLPSPQPVTAAFAA
jgi:hypothetical protein